MIAVLTAASGPASGPDSATTQSAEGDPISFRLTERLLDTRSTTHRPPLSSDAEHARTIDPVLTRGTAVWIHEDLPSPPLTVMSGRMFSYRDANYDPLDAPVLKLRAIDDEQVIPFLVRVLHKPDRASPNDATIILSFPVPAIFSPRIEAVSAWVETAKAPTSTRHQPDRARIDIRVPLSTATIERAHRLGEPITVIVMGQLVLESYRQLPRGQFVDLEKIWADPAIAALAVVERGRDVRDSRERNELAEIGRTIAPDSMSPYEQVLTINRWVSSLLVYEKTAATRSPIEILEDRSGDCDDFTALTAALLRTIGIPARRPTGLLYDFDTLAAHTWVEAALPTRDGNLHWFVVDPTLAGAAETENLNARFVQFRDRILLYPVRPEIAVEGLGGRRKADLFFNWRESTERSLSQPRELNRFFDQVILDVDREFSRRAEGLAASGLKLRRASASIAGSPYLVVDRPSGKKTSSRIRLRLENEERLVIELSAEAGLDLQSKAAAETADRIRTAYNEISDLCFSDARARFNLELVFLRDPHSDRLQTVRLSIGRYLTEHFLDSILAKLAKFGILTEEEVASTTRLAEKSGDQNLYVLQELARTLPAQ